MTTEKKKEPKARPPFTVVKQDPLTIEGPFKIGFLISEKRQMTFRMRECSVDDMLNAEAEGHVVNTPLAYELSLAAQQLVSVGSFEGAVSLSLMREDGRLKPADITVLRRAQAELERLQGEG